MGGADSFLSPLVSVSSCPATRMEAEQSLDSVLTAPLVGWWEGDPVQMPPSFLSDISNPITKSNVKSIPMCQQLYSAHFQAQSQHVREQTTPSRCGPAVDPRAPRHTQASSQGKFWGSTLPTHPTVASGLLPGGPGPGCCLRCPLCRPASLVGSWPRGCWCWAWPTLSRDKCPRCIQGRWPQPRGPAIPRHLRRVACGSASWRGQPRSSTQCPGGPLRLSIHGVTGGPAVA